MHVCFSHIPPSPSHFRYSSSHRDSYASNFDKMAKSIAQKWKSHKIYTTNNKRSNLPRCGRGPLPVTLIGLAGSILGGSNVRFVSTYVLVPSPGSAFRLLAQLCVYLFARLSRRASESDFVWSVNIVFLGWIPVSPRSFYLMYHGLCDE